MVDLTRKIVFRDVTMGFIFIYLFLDYAQPKIAKSAWETEGKCGYSAGIH